MKYYNLFDDINCPGRWYLGEIVGVEDNWQFVYGQRISEEWIYKSISVMVVRNGQPMDFTINEGYGVPIVSERFRTQIGDLDGVQFIPVSITGYEELRYFILVATNSFACVDEQSSIFQKFVKDDPVRPDLAGQYSWFSKLKIDPSKANNKDIFRIENLVTHLIVSERVKDAIDEINMTGAKFEQV